MEAKESDGREKAVTIRGASFSYPGEGSTLTGLDLEVFTGERLGLLGRSGCGKSTLLSILAGILPYRMGGSFSGTGEVLGNALPYGPDMASGSCGLVFQDPEKLFVRGDVLSEIGFSLRCTGEAEAVVTSLASRVMEDLGIAYLAGKRIRDLSGGEKQLVAIASALVRRPRLLLMDEPSSQLDPRGRRALERGIRALRKSDPDLTIVQVEHRQDGVFGCDRVGIMAKGGIVRIGPPSDVLTDRTMMEDAGIGTDMLIETYLAARRKGLTQERIPFKMPLPRIVEDLRGMLPHGSAKDRSIDKVLPRTILEGVRFSYPGSGPVIRGMDLDLSGPGSVCIMGPNGSGKTTLGKIISGLLTPDRGRATVEGRVFHIFQRVSSMLFEDTVAAVLRKCPRSVPGPVLRGLGIDRLTDRDPLMLSAGESQRLGLAMAYGSGASLVVMDEPFKGLDGASYRSAIGVIKREEFPPFVLITNDPDHAHLCSRLVILRSGRIADAGRPDRVLGRDRNALALRWPKPGPQVIGKSARMRSVGTYRDIIDAIEVMP